MRRIIFPKNKKLKILINILLIVLWERCANYIFFWRNLFGIGRNLEILSNKLYLKYCMFDYKPSQLTCLGDLFMNFLSFIPTLIGIFLITYLLWNRRIRPRPKITKSIR